MTRDEAREAQLAAGAAYDAAVDAVWAQIPRDWGTRQSWDAAKPGMRAAQQAMDAELRRIQAELTGDCQRRDREAG
jgi:hypothetical protein